MPRFNSVYFLSLLAFSLFLASCSCYDTSRNDDKMGIYGFYIGQSLDDAVKNIQSRGYSITEYTYFPGAKSWLPKKILPREAEVDLPFDQLALNCQAMVELSRNNVMENLNLSKKICYAADELKNAIDKNKNLAWSPIILAIQEKGMPTLGLNFMSENDKPDFRLVSIGLINIDRQLAPQIQRDILERFGKPEIREINDRKLYVWQKDGVYGYGLQTGLIEPFDVVEFNSPQIYGKFVRYWRNIIDGRDSAE